MDGNDPKKLVIFASPRCTIEPRLYKAYFNVAWFVRAFREVLERYTILTTPETQYADEKALEKENSNPQPFNVNGEWDVPTDPSILSNAETIGEFGFDAQVSLMGAIGRREVERVLMFMDPLDTKEYLPETYALIRNCTLAGVGLHINLGATYWAESEQMKVATERAKPAENAEPTSGKWRVNSDFYSRMNPKEQAVHFIAHDSEKEKLSRFVYHYREILAEAARTGWRFSGTFGTCTHIEKYLADHLAPYWECPSFAPAGSGTTGHGPTGGDVVIADEIRKQWPVDEGREGETEEERLLRRAKATSLIKTPREEPVSHTILFFIDYYHARPHETDIHVLLRTCLNPHRGVHLILNERSAIEWGETIRNRCFSTREQCDD